MEDNGIPVGRGVKQGENPEQFRDGVIRPNVSPDRISPTVASYFRIPPVWIVEPPNVLSHEPHFKKWRHETVFRRTMNCGIEVRVQRDGLFAFDFTLFPQVTYTIIPGYVHPEPPYKVPREHSAAEEQAEATAVYRAQIMNAHQACLITAEAIVHGRGAAMGYPINAWNTFKSINLDLIPSYRDDTEDPHAVARNVFNNSYGLTREREISRRVIELDVVEESFRLLDHILTCSHTAIAMVEGAYMAASRSVEKRFGESVVLGWTVCEQLISIAWREMLEGKRTSGSNNTMTSSRIDKLTGRDYSASVMTEVLQLNGIIDGELYRWLERARKARNAWAHSMKTPNRIEVHACLSAAKRLFKQLLDIDIRLQSGGRGGVPQWPVWMLPVKNQY